MLYMKKRLSITVILGACTVMTGMAQQKTFGSAIVKSKTSITFPENNNRGGDNGDGDFGGRPTGMESKSTVYYRGDMIKIDNESDFGNNTMIIDKKSGRTTTLIQAMGRKTGFYSTEEEREAMEERMRKRMDSIRQARGESADDSRQARTQDIEVVQTNDTKKIAGFSCKKAIIKSKTRQGQVNETIVWYCPDLKRPGNYPLNFGSTGGRGFAGAMSGASNRNNTNGFDKIDGFIMGMEISRPNGFKMETEVTEVQTDPTIADKVFEIPKGYDIKPMSEMERQFGGRMFSRGGNPGGGNN